MVQIAKCCLWKIIDLNECRTYILRAPFLRFRGGGGGEWGWGGGEWGGGGSKT